MKKILDNKYFQLGVMLFCVIAVSILLYFSVKNINYIFSFIGSILKILMPLIFGLVLAYIMHPIVNFFENKVFKKINKETPRRNLSILCTIVLILGVIVALISIVIPQLVESIQVLIIKAPTYASDLEDSLRSWLSSDSDISNNVINNYDTIINYVINALNNVVLPIVNDTMSKLSSGIVGIFTFVFNLVIGLVFAVYILANTSNFKAGVRKILYSLFNAESVNGFIDRVHHINHVFCQFMVGKICDSSIVALITFIFLFAVQRNPYALLIAVIIGITDLIPYFGPYIGTIPSVLIICLVDPLKALTFILFIIVLQQIDGNLITPRIQKQATGLPSFWVLFAITLFGGLFGIVGLLIAVPCFTIIYEIFIEILNNRLKRKNLPVEDEYYKEISTIETKTVKAKIKNIK